LGIKQEQYEPQNRFQIGNTPQAKKQVLKSTISKHEKDSGTEIINELLITKQCLKH